MVDHLDKCKFCEHKVDAQIWKLICCVVIAVVVGFVAASLWIF